MTDTNGVPGDIHVVPELVQQALARLNSRPGLIAASQARDERTSKKTMRFDSDGYHFAGASGLASAQSLAGRSGSTLKDARKTLEKLDLTGDQLLAKLTTTLGNTVGSDTAATDPLTRVNDPR